MTTYKLKNIGYSIGVIKEDIDTVDIRLKIVTTGEYTDMSGKSVKIDKALLDAIAKKYKEDAFIVWQEDHNTTSDIAANIDDFDNRNAPMRKDHNTETVDNITGNIIGLLEVVHLKDGKYGLFCTVRIKGQDNKQKVKLKLYRNISIQFHPETKELVEISWVDKGADWTAVSMLGEYKGDNSNTINLYENNIINNKYLTFNKVCDTIRLKDELILKLDHQIKVDKYLIALCKRKKITKYEANLLKTKIGNEANALSVIKLVDELMEPRLPKSKFIDGKSPDISTVLKKFEFNLHEGNIMSGQQRLSSDPLTDAFLKLEAQEQPNTVAMSTPNMEDPALSKEKLAKHRKYLREKMADCYEKDEKELAKKFREKLAKFEEDCEMGKLAALSEYDIEEDSKNSEEIKKKEKELSKAKEELAIALAEKEKLANEIIRLQQPQTTSKTPEEQLNILMAAFNSISQPKSTGAAQ